jgi:AmmeMemoRadiSam system protein B
MNRSRVVQQSRGGGQWYPGERHELESMVAAHIENAAVPAGMGRIVAVTAPHAGYVYSGSTAGHTFRALRDHAETFGQPETVVVLGFSHRREFEGIALMGGDALLTPLGEIGLDREATDLLLSLDSLFALNNLPHDGEHSAENEIPFIQQALPGSKVVIGLFGGHGPEIEDRVARSLVSLAEEKDIILVASTDLLHDPDYALVREMDQVTMAQMVAMDDQDLEDRWSPGFQVCCGIRPVITAIRFARHRGCAGGTKLAYRNSGDDDPESRGEWVVGYGSVAFSLSETS